MATNPNDAGAIPGYPATREQTHVRSQGHPDERTATDAVKVTAGELKRVLDVPLTIHVELGQRRIKIRDLLALAPGSLLELDALAGAPLTVFANDVIVAHGEAVVVDGHYGVRVTQVIGPEERARLLAERVGAK